MRISHLSISKKLYCGIAAIVSCFIVLLVVAGVNLAKLSEANSRNVHAYQVLAEAEATLEALVNVETGERGFALTGAQASLEPYDAGLAAFAVHWEKAKSLTSDNPSQQARLQAIRRNKELWVRVALEPVLNLRRGVAAGSETMDKLIAFVQAAKGKKAKDALRAELDEFKRAERSLLDLRSAESAALGRTMRAILLGGGAAVTLAALVLAVLIVRSILIPMRQVLRATEDLRDGEGDLTYRLPKLGAEFGELADSLNGFMRKLHGIIGDVRTSTDAIACASEQISAGNSDLSSRTELQASSLQETASSMEELTGTVRRNAENAGRANQLARSASEVAKQGGVLVSQVVRTMGAINDSAGKISDIISVIDGIAFQTNILALNAAVEAARAGEQGRGFAVVASEVRNLAQRSAAAAKDIKMLIDDSVERVEAGAKLVGRAGATMEEIVVSVQRVTDIVDEISVASGEQASGIVQVNDAIMQMDQATQLNASLLEEAAAAAQSLQDQSAALAQVVGGFRIDYAAMQTHPATPAKQPARHVIAYSRAARSAPAAPARAPLKTAVNARVAGGDWVIF